MRSQVHRWTPLATALVQRVPGGPGGRSLGSSIPRSLSSTPARSAHPDKDGRNATFMRHRVPVQRASSRLERFPTGSCLGSHLALRIRKVLAQASGTREVQRLPRRTRLRAGTGDTVSPLPPAERVFFRKLSPSALSFQVRLDAVGHTGAKADDVQLQGALREGGDQAFQESRRKFCSGPLGIRALRACGTYVEKHNFMPGKLTWNRQGS